MQRIDGALRRYAWGSHDALAKLTRRDYPTPHPEAELWFGAHPGDPSPVIDGDAPGATLIDVIDSDPRSMLGDSVLGLYGSHLPFLMKILAAEEALSLQAHPSLDQAREGFARENAQGIPLDAPDRNFRDDNHKPELLVALTDFDALVGFRPAAETVKLFDALDVPELQPYCGLLRGEPDAGGIRALFTTWIASPRSVFDILVPAVVEGATRILDQEPGSPYTTVAQTTVQLAHAYGRDGGVLCSLLLNRVSLKPAEAVFVKAGSLHAYLSGIGVEIMANSDNVLRGGLTPKHVDVPELMRVLDFHPVEQPRLSPALRDGDPGVLVAEYHVPAREFQLVVYSLAGGASTSIASDGPGIILCTDGDVVVRGPQGKEDVLNPGQAVWVPDCENRVTVANSHNRTPATVFCARVGGHVVGAS